MLLAIDIGNSTTKFGFYKADKLTAKSIITTNPENTAAQILQKIQKILPEPPGAMIISSVVNEMESAYKKLGIDHFDCEPLFVDHTFDFGFSIKYFPPEDCGPDRLVDAYAAVEQYGAPVIVCDFGTATTIDFVNEQREFLGGIITPGINTLASALFDKTSRLPRVELKKPTSVVGNSTVSSIQSGIYYGYIGLVDGIIDRMRAEIGSEEPRVVSTGGFANLIADESKYVEIVEENLMLEGLRLAYQNWEPKTHS